MCGPIEPGGSGKRPADQPHVEDDAQREELERSRANASKIAMVCFAASVAVGVGFVFDLVTMSASECGPPAVNPGWFVVGMIGSALVGTFAAGSARSKSRALDASTDSANVLVALGVVLLIVTIVGSIIGVMAAVLHGALGCL